MDSKFRKKNSILRSMLTETIQVYSDLFKMSLWILLGPKLNAINSIFFHNIFELTKLTTKNNIQDLSFKNNKFAYFLPYVSFGIVNPTFQQYELLPILFFGFLLFAFFMQKKSFDKLFYVIVFILLALLAVQAFNFGNFTIKKFCRSFYDLAYTIFYSSICSI